MIASSCVNPVARTVACAASISAWASEYPAARHNPLAASSNAVTSRYRTVSWAASAISPSTCRDCLRAALDSIEVPLVHPAPQPSATDQWAYIERLRQATGKAQQAVLPGIGDVPLDGELFTYRELRDRKTNQVLATQIGYRDKATYFVPTSSSSPV